MSRRDRALLEAYVGPSYPELSFEADVLAARERAVTLAPDHPDAWYFLGDQYFHQGAYLGYTDWMERSATAFERALALDSTFAGPISHMVDLAFWRNDTAAMHRYADRFRQTEGAMGGGYSLAVRYRIAEFFGDSTLMAEVRTSFDTMPDRPVFLSHFIISQGGGSFDLADELLDIAARRASSQDQRGFYLGNRMIHLFDRGRPSAASLRADSLGRIHGDMAAAAYLKTMAALYWAPDSLMGAAGAARLEAAVRAARADSAQARYNQANVACALAHWRIAEGRLSEVPDLIRRMQTLSQNDDPLEYQTPVRSCTLILEAMLAVARRAPDARQRVTRADSFLLRGPSVSAPTNVRGLIHYENLVIARLYATLGEVQAGLAAARRAGAFSFVIVPHLREQGRLAALAGDREAALEAYAEVLRWWSDVEPSMEAEVAAVRAEVERLTREGG